MTKVLVFGTFDLLHPGHEHFLSQARSLGDELIVSVAQDEIVKQLKLRLPRHTLSERMQALQKLNMVTQVIAGDSVLGAYTHLEHVRPDIVAFGYDQADLTQDFQRFQQAVGDETPIVVLKPYRPEEFKSSLLRQASDDQSL